jgi:glycosyltransferase involved in cell wall biosynthesis
VAAPTFETENPRPRVSVIVPAYDSAAYLPEAIASIRAQQYAPLEIILVDDGSTDATAELVPALGADIKYIYQQNRGPAAARNHGLAQATGSVIAFLDADDLWAPQKLELQLTALYRHPTADCVIGHIRAFQTDPEAFLVSKRRQNTPFLAHQVGSALFRRSVVERIGDFDETLRFSEDIDWFLRAREAGVSILVLPQVALLYRVHSNNMTRTGGHSHYLTQVLRRSIHRRRQGGGSAVRDLSPLQRSEGR